MLDHLDRRLARRRGVAKQEEGRQGVLVDRVRLEELDRLAGGVLELVPAPLPIIEAGQVEAAPAPRPPRAGGRKWMPVRAAVRLAPATVEYAGEGLHAEAASKLAVTTARAPLPMVGRYV